MINLNGEFKTTAVINSLGYRGHEFSPEKKPGEKRILMIGDSMTFGWGVADDETYPFLTEKILRSFGRSNIEVINAGYKGGLSPDGYYVYLKNEGLKLKPDLVVIGFFVFNDIEDLAANLWVKVNEKGLPEQIESCCHQVDGNILRNKSISFKFRFPYFRESHLFLAAANFLQKRFGLFPDKALLSTKGEQYLGCTLNSECRPKFVEEEDKAIKLLSEMKKLTEGAGGKFFVLLLPVDYQIYPQAFDKYSKYGMKWPLKTGEEDLAQKRIGERLLQNQIEFLDLLPVFKDKQKEGYPFFRIDAHFNSKGTEITAEELGNYLIFGGLKF